MLLTSQEEIDLKEILRLHDEAFKDYLTRHNYGHKSSEGCVTIHVPNFWDRDGWDNPGAAGNVSVEVYSYALGPSRSHWFNSTAEALKNVREWHRKQMEAPDEED